jgi:hypothetical protein
MAIAFSISSPKLLAISQIFAEPFFRKREADAD